MGEFACNRGDGYRTDDQAEWLRHLQAHDTAAPKDVPQYAPEAALPELESVKQPAPRSEEQYPKLPKPPRDALKQVSLDGPFKYYTTVSFPSDSGALQACFVSWLEEMRNAGWTIGEITVIHITEEKRRKDAVWEEKMREHLITALQHIETQERRIEDEGSRRMVPMPTPETMAGMMSPMGMPRD